MVTLTALVSRSEIRDLVDVQQLVEHGLSDAAAMAFTLDQLCIGPEARLPGDTDGVALERFRGELIGRLRLLAQKSAGP